MSQQKTKAKEKKEKEMKEKKKGCWTHTKALMMKPLVL